VDLEILVSSILRAHGFNVTDNFLSVRAERVARIDFHPPGILLYAELDVERGFAYNENVHVNAGCRHRGIGTRLVAAHEAICREARLTILINDNRNPDFWRRKGYLRLNPFWQMRLGRRLAIDFKGPGMYKRP
jgi:ribosomal protein S18 acetylase RimI-like enzyme